MGHTDTVTGDTVLVVQAEAAPGRTGTLENDRGVVRAR
jgi:hypothetical protein